MSDNYEVRRQLINTLKNVKNNEEVASIFTELLKKWPYNFKEIMLEIFADAEIPEKFRIVAVQFLRPFVEEDITFLRKALWHESERVRRIAGMIINEVLESKGVNIKGIFAKGPYKYEVYTAETIRAAREFLSDQQVNEPRYYIEVETPEGMVGRDIKGMYEQ